MGIANLNQDRFMKIADLREAAMEWTVTIEGPDEFGEIQRAQVQIEKGFERLAAVTETCIAAAQCWPSGF